MSAWPTGVTGVNPIAQCGDTNHPDDRCKRDNPSFAGCSLYLGHDGPHGHHPVCGKTWDRSLTETCAPAGTCPVCGQVRPS